MSVPVIVPSTTTRAQAVSDIVASVALEQAALSHILNAESEKILAVIASATSPQDMLDVNASVKHIVNKITQLEMVLQSKLILFGDCLCPCIELLDTAVQATAVGTTVIKHTVTNYTINLGLIIGVGTPGTVIVTTVPAGLPISVSGTLPLGMSISGNVLSYLSSLQTTGKIVTLNIGSGVCTQVLTINFIGEFA